jgi:predicted ATP-dependent protease
MPWAKEDLFKKYEVNVIVDNSKTNGAPVIMEFNPTYQNLFGRTEKEAQFGALTTDFTMIRAGTLHKANNGYLIIQVEDLLRNPFAYDALKRDIRERNIFIEEPEERYGFISVKTLKPQPIPLEAKIILIGTPNIYQALFTMDMDFKELFKVKAEFDTTMNRTEENIIQYTSFACTICEKENLKHIDASGLAKLIEYSSRIIEDQHKLSTQFSVIADIIREANFYAEEEKTQLITASQINKAIDERLYRSKLIQEKVHEMIQRGFYLIDTEQQVGQVNWLSVMGLGDLLLAHPHGSRKHRYRT